MMNNVESEVKVDEPALQVIATCSLVGNGPFVNCSVRSSEPPNSFYIQSSTLPLGVENQLNLEINRPGFSSAKRKQRPSRGDRAQGHSEVVRNQQPNQGFVLIPQLGFQLNSKMLIPFVNVTAATDADTQSYIKYQGEYVKNTTVLANTIPYSKLQRSSVSNTSAASCSYVSNPKDALQPTVTGGANTCNSDINTESIQTHGNEESPLKGVKVENESDSGSKGTELLQSSSPPPQPATEKTKLEGKEECFCSVCNVDFGFPDLLEDHINGTEFICRSCTAIFHNHQELETHFFSHKKFKCEFCKKSFYVRKDLVDHKTSVLTCNKRSTKERCKICNTKFASKADVQLHMERRHPDGEPQPFTCSVCNSSYKIQDHLKRHMMMNHEVYESIECDICHQIVLGPAKLKLHIKGKHLQSPEICPICKKVLTSKGRLKLHMQSHNGEEKMCYICGAKVKGNASYRYHMYNHENKRKTCSLCSITFNSSSEKSKHYREKHLKDKLTPSICELCGKEFKNTAILKNHMMTHSDVKPYECGVCGATFKTKAILKTHSRVHTDVRKYSCDWCGESFRWKPTFTKHILKCESTRHVFKCEATQNDDTS